MQEFYGLDRDIEGSAKRWKKFVESDAIENEKFPTEWKNKTMVQQLCIIRVLRPDRMIYAIELVLRTISVLAFIYNLQWQLQLEKRPSNLGDQDNQ